MNQFRMALTCLVLVPVISYAHSYEDVLGKIFIVSSGSSLGGFIMSVSVKVTGRNTVSVGFVSGDMIWNEVDISALEEGKRPPDITKVTINCKEKTYAVYPPPEEENAFSLREYKAGTKHKWGDYSTQELVSNVNDELKMEVTKYFKTVCEYTAQ